MIRLATPDTTDMMLGVAKSEISSILLLDLFSGSDGVDARMTENVIKQHAVTEPR